MNISLPASSPIWAREASLVRTRLSSAPRSRVLARLAQIGELARRLIGQIWIHHRQVELTRQKVTFHRLQPTRVHQTSAFLPRFHWKNQANFLSTIKSVWKWTWSFAVEWTTARVVHLTVKIMLIRSSKYDSFHIFQINKKCATKNNRYINKQRESPKDNWSTSLIWMGILNCRHRLEITQF